MTKKVFVSGCFDMLHSGHIYFFECAAQYGDLYVGIGSDDTIKQLKNNYTICNEKERLYQVKAIKYVKEAWINSGKGFMDFEEELSILKPDIFYVNDDGHSFAKQLFCKKHGIQYIVDKRSPKALLPKRSTTQLKTMSKIPYRIDLAGGWLDQPFVSKLYFGPVLTIAINSDYPFNERSGLASSTRKKAIELWGNKLPKNKNKETLAKMLFCFDNPPGTKEISGSQDALGIVFPGVNCLMYTGRYWPESIASIQSEDILTWLEQCVFLMKLDPRQPTYNVLGKTHITKSLVTDLAEASKSCWQAILNKDILALGNNFTASFNAQVSMFPNMLPEKIEGIINTHKHHALGWKLSGAGGGGYIIFIAENKFHKDLVSVKIVRPKRQNTLNGNTFIDKQNALDNNKTNLTKQV